jgi:hypothetical protein
MGHEDWEIAAVVLGSEFDNARYNLYGRSQKWGGYGIEKICAVKERRRTSDGEGRVNEDGDVRMLFGQNIDLGHE